VIGFRIQQAQAVFQFTQVLGFREERFDLPIFLSGQVVIDGIQQSAKYIHFLASYKPHNLFIALRHYRLFCQKIYKAGGIAAMQ
jgi:hypothetical protein